MFTSDDVDAMLKRQKKGYETKLKDQRQVTLEECRALLKRYAQNVCNKLTLNHNNVIEQFIDWKERAEPALSSLTTYKQRMVDAENLAAFKSPI